MDDFLGDFINPRNKISTSLLVGCGLPGGMMGSMMSDLQGMHVAINAALRKNNKPEVSIDNLLVQLFQSEKNFLMLNQKFPMQKACSIFRITGTGSTNLNGMVIKAGFLAQTYMV